MGSLPEGVLMGSPWESHRVPISLLAREVR